jgi:nicotinamidase-related amidase
LADDTQPASSEQQEQQEQHEQHEQHEQQEQQFHPELPPLMPPIEKEGDVEKRERRGPQTTGAFQKLPMYVVFRCTFCRIYALTSPNHDS